jgi:hypothetical protein
MLFVKKPRQMHVILKLKRVMLLLQGKKDRTRFRHIKVLLQTAWTVWYCHTSARRTHHCTLSNLLRSFHTTTICIKHFILSYYLLGLQSSSFKCDFLHQNFEFVSLIPHPNYTSSPTKYALLNCRTLRIKYEGYINQDVAP